jgi:hypothetical protein
MYLGNWQFTTNGNQAAGRNRLVVWLAPRRRESMYVRDNVWSVAGTLPCRTVPPNAMAEFAAARASNTDARILSMTYYKQIRSD